MAPNVSADSLSVFPEYINLGDSVKIEISSVMNINELRLKIVSPSQKEYYPKLVKIKNNKYSVFFSDTFEKGFLTENWNQYKVRLYKMNGLILQEKSFYLRDNNKTLYFTLYIDDMGAGGYPKNKNIQWYHEIAGPINLGYQCDSIGCVPLKKFMKKYDLEIDFVFHHFHSYEFAGNRIILKIDSFFNWYRLHRKINESISKLTGRNIKLRDRHIFLFLLLLTIIWMIVYFKNKNLFSKLGVSLFTILFLIFLIASQTANYKHNEKNIKINIDDIQWCKSFLKKIKNKFLENSYFYPCITRHGWNLPPANLNEFYLKEMNVLADASAIRAKRNYYFLKHNIAKRSIEWRDSPLPYYTNINEDLNSLWDGKEENRGLLEIPLTFDNINAYGFSDKDKQLINDLPNGALVSTYLHPSHSVIELEPVIKYLKKNFDVKFLSVYDYLKIYMNYFPRPVIVDLDKQKSYWGYLENFILFRIFKTEQLDILASMDRFQINVKTSDTIPYLGLVTETINSLKFDNKRLIGKKIGNKYFYLIKNIEAGIHFIKMDNHI